MEGNGHVKEHRTSEDERDKAKSKGKHILKVV